MCSTKSTFSLLGVNDYASKYRKRSCTSAFPFRFYACEHLTMIVRTIVKWYSNSRWREIETTDTRSINLLGRISCTERVNFISWTLLKLQHPILIERMRNSKSGRFTATVSAFHFWFHVEKKDIIVQKMIIADSQMIASVIIPMIINVTIINSYNRLCNTNCGNTSHGVRIPNENRNIYLFVVIGSYIIVKYLVTY